MSVSETQNVIFYLSALLGDSASVKGTSRRIVPPLAGLCCPMSCVRGNGTGKVEGSRQVGVPTPPVLALPDTPVVISDGVSAVLGGAGGHLIVSGGNRIAIPNRISNTSKPIS